MKRIARAGGIAIIEDLFKEHFPNLNRRSALITLFGFLEHELGKLCVKLKVNLNLAIDLKDIQGKGIER